MKVVARAPGKIFLLGEYAVLEGAPALVVAVDRYVTAEIGPTTASTWELDAPDICPQPVHFTYDDHGAVRWQAPETGERLGVVAAVLSAFGRRGWLPAARWRLRVDSSAFFDGSDKAPNKLGLGSSAAVTVALASALAAYAGRREATEDRSAWLRDLLEIHRAFQGGRGSGFDIAAALHGGDIVFAPNAGDPRVAAFTWPAELERIYVWSGHSASTARFLQTLDAWRHASPRRYARHLRMLSAAAELGAAAARAQNADWMLTAVGDMAAALRKFGHASKIPIFSDDHEIIAAAVSEAGGVYKPCGAGGGDLGMAVVRGLDGKRHVIEALGACGYRCMELAPDRAGLVVESKPDLE